MGFVCTIICLIFALFSYIYERRISNLITPFYLLWTVVLFLSSLSLYKMREVDDITYIIMTVGLLFFGVGYFWFNGKVFMIGDRKFFSHHYALRYRAIFAVQVVCLAFLLMMSTRTIQYLLTDDGWNIVRNMYQGYSGESLFKFKWESLFNSIVLAPFMYVSVCIIGILVYKKNINKHKLIFVLSIADLFLYCLMNGGRVLLLYLAIIFLLLNSLFGIEIKLSKRQKFLIFVLMLILVGAMLYITAARKSSVDEWDLVHQIYSYFSITPAIFDYWREYIETHNIYTYGMYFFNGLFSVLRLIYSKFGVEFALKNTVEELISLTETFVPVFARKNYNAFVSIFFCFYSDFRMFGVVVGSFILGGISQQVYYAVKKKTDEFYLMLFLLFAYCLFKTMTKWEGTSPIYIYAFMWARILCKKYWDDSYECINEL